MKNRNLTIIFSTVLVVIAGLILLIIKLFSPPDNSVEIQASNDGYVGARSCRECHERFYDLWSPSHHGKAMQPVADVLLKEQLLLPDAPKKVGSSWYEVFLDKDILFMIERTSQTANDEIERYEAKWALGGRNIYYFLTQFEGGRLQTMPLAYDINRKEWYSNPESAVRHFVDNASLDEEVDWKHSLYTFNTACHSCHVSQLNKNYDLSSNTYHTTWKEPGINCETCHGPSEEHIRVCREAGKKDEVPEDLKIILTKKFTPDQHNSSCASCHAKGMPLTQSYIPGEPFFQHFNLITLENPDYFPDGRDLGENYTMTGWYQSSCAANSDLHCVTCHSSSGRYRYKNNDNEICAKCHQDRVDDFEAHSRHTAKDSLTCVSCHMPKTEFARMTRTDHSMRPPTPATTLEYESPNACNICHVEENASWANSHVTEWHGNYQDETLEYARLIFQGRNGNFQNIEQMLEMINNSDVNMIFRNSIIRILISQTNKYNQHYFFQALHDTSPLIRASATEALGFLSGEEVKSGLLTAVQDSVLVVRNRASVSLISYTQNMFTEEEWRVVENNLKGYEDYLMSSPDTWTAHYNLGNFYHGRGMYQKAIESYDKATTMEDGAIMPLVNAGLSYSILGNYVMAEEKLRKALEIEPGNAIVNLNYGLLLGQAQRFDQAKIFLTRALNSDSTLSTAAYNLAVISAQSSLKEAMKYISMAYELEPENTKYIYSFAYYAYLNGNRQKAISTLQKLINVQPNYIDAYLFLGNIYEESKNISAAISIYEKAASIEGIPEEYRQNIRMKANMLKQ